MGPWLLELIVLIVLVCLLITSGVLYWRKRSAAACAVFGAAAGIVVPVAVCGFRVAVSSRSAFVYFSVLDPDVIDPLWRYPNADAAERVAALLNGLLVIFGAGIGAFLRLGAWWLAIRRGNTSRPPEAGV